MKLRLLAGELIDADSVGMVQIFTMTLSIYSRPTKSQSQIVGENLTRIQIERGLSMDRLIAVTGLNERTLRGIKTGTTKPRANTIASLATSLEVAVGDLLDERLSEEELFDRKTNPAAAEFVDTNPRLFRGWMREEFAEFFSRFGVGGGQTEEGAREAASFMNERRKLLNRVAFLLETPSGEMLRSIIEQMVKRERVAE